MFKNYIISAIRNIARNKFYAVLNILGLSVGLAAFIFILLYVRDELTYDKHNLLHKRIVRLESDYTISNKHDKFAMVPVPMGPAFKLEFPEVEQYARFSNIGNVLIRYGDKEYYEDNFYFADSTIFEVFTYDCINGTPEKALSEPYTMVMTETTAKKYFGDENPVGEMVKTGSGNSYKVTAVIRDIPGNSHLRFDALLSVSTLEELVGADRFNSMEPIAFWNIGVYTYLLLKENSSMETVMEKFQPFYEKYMKPIGDQINASFKPVYRPLAQTHFASGVTIDQPTGNMAYVYIFSAVALFILLLATINYMNMATARSGNRAREVGMRKVSGAFRGQLVWQFMVESILLTTIALLIAVVLVVLLLNDFNQISGKVFDFSILLDPAVLIYTVSITLLVGLLAGTYPAFYLSSFQPITVLKGSTGGSGKRSSLMRRTLVVIQFFIAIVMIIGTFTVSRQIRFLQDKDLGFEEENLVVMELQDSTFQNQVNTFKEELLQSPDIKGVTVGTGVPGRINWIQVVRVEREDEMADVAMILAQVDYDFIDVMDIVLAQGRNFDRNMGTDAQEAVLINETAAKQLGWESDPIGKKIQYGFDLEGDEGRILKVIGVMKDFHFNSLHNKIEPIIFFITEQFRFLVTARINGDRKKEALGFIGQKWSEFSPERPFDYTFLTDTFDEMYQSEEKLALIFRIATALTIFIALLGMLGLSSFIAERRTKEIGIRKVVGASMANIMRLLYREFVYLILIGFVLAVPVAWWRLDIWLRDTFIYFAPLSWVSFLVAGLVAFLIGFATISFHIVRASASNPVDAIKYE